MTHRKRSFRPHDGDAVDIYGPRREADVQGTGGAPIRARRVAGVWAITLAGVASAVFVASAGQGASGTQGPGAGRGATAGQSAGAGPGAPVAAGPRPVASIREVMTTLIDPAADVLFDAVALDVTPAGVKETSPTTNEQWTALRTAALQLAEGANLLMVPGRLVEPPAGSGHQAEPPAPGDLAPAAIQRMITADRPAFNQWAERLRRAATDALASIEKRDAKALFASGEHLDDACEQCHKRYWYPDPPAAGPAR